MPPEDVGCACNVLNFPPPDPQRVQQLPAGQVMLAHLGHCGMCAAINEVIQETTFNTSDPNEWATPIHDDDARHADAAVLAARTAEAKEARSALRHAEELLEAHEARITELTKAQSANAAHANGAR